MRNTFQSCYKVVATVSIFFPTSLSCFTCVALLHGRVCYNTVMPHWHSKSWLTLSQKFCLSPETSVRKPHSSSLPRTKRRWRVVMTGIKLVLRWWWLSTPRTPTPSIPMWRPIALWWVSMPWQEVTYCTARQEMTSQWFPLFGCFFLWAHLRRAIDFG